MQKYVFHYNIYYVVSFVFNYQFHIGNEQYV